MQKPVITETMQIGIVVRNLDAAVRRYENDYGIGPWEAHEFKPGERQAGRAFHANRSSHDRTRAVGVNVLVLGSKIPRLPGDHFQYFRGSLA